MIRFLFFVIIFIFPTISADGQFLARAEQHLSFSGQNETRISGSISRVSLHYQTRLSKVRLEFLPGINYSHYWSDPNRGRMVGLTLPVVAYPLDFVNDCDCPTFSKKGEWLKKGLFIQIIPAWHYSPDQELKPTSFFSAGIGGGIDWGISDFLTLSPYAGYEFQHKPQSDFSSFHTIHAGIQILFRSEFRRRYR